MKEFKINDSLTLKLDCDKIEIYMKGKLFEQCNDFPTVLVAIDKVLGNDDSENYKTFSALLDVAKVEGWIEEFFPTVLETIDKITGQRRYKTFYFLLNVSKETGRTEELFPAFFESINKLTGHHSYLAFLELIGSIKGTELLNKFYSQIENRFLAFLETIYKLPEEDKIKAFSVLISSIKNTNILNTYFYQIETLFLNLLNSVANRPGIYLRVEFFVLIGSAEETGLIKEHIPAFLAAIDKFPNDDKVEMFYHLMDSVKRFALLNKFYSQIRTQFFALLHYIDILPIEKRYSPFCNLLGIAKETGWIEEDFPVFFEVLGKLPINRKTQAFLDVYDVAKINHEIIVFDNEFAKITLYELRDQELMTLYAIAKTFLRKEKIDATDDDAYAEYQSICKNYSIEPHVKMQFRRYIRGLTQMRIITSKTAKIEDPTRGRYIKISLLDVPAEKLAKLIEDIFRKRRDFNITLSHRSSD